jgi:hypothetical protein
VTSRTPDEMQNWLRKRKQLHEARAAALQPLCEKYKFTLGEIQSGGMLAALLALAGTTDAEVKEALK